MKSNGLSLEFESKEEASRVLAFLEKIYVGKKVDDYTILLNLSSSILEISEGFLIPPSSKTTPSFLEENS